MYQPGRESLKGRDFSTRRGVATVVAIRRLCFVRRLAAAFWLVEVLVILVIVSVFAAAAALDYSGRRAKITEAKVVAGALWTALQGDAATACGTAALVSRAYRRAGLSTAGETIPARWSVSAGEGNSIVVDCSTGTITPDGDVFTMSGTESDVAPLRVMLSYAADGTPPAQFKCSVDFGANFVDC